jgi:hypothetical protein
VTCFDHLKNRRGKVTSPSYMPKVYTPNQTANWVRPTHSQYPINQTLTYDSWVREQTRTLPCGLGHQLRALLRNPNLGKSRSPPLRTRQIYRRLQVQGRAAAEVPSNGIISIAAVFIPRSCWRYRLFLVLLPLFVGSGRYVHVFFSRLRLAKRKSVVSSIFSCKG